MWQIAKSQLYQLKKQTLVRTVFILALIAIAAMISLRVLLYDEISDGRLLTLGEMVTDSVPVYVMMTFFFIIILVGDICCNDYNDKNANYEILSGHTRIESYLGRAILCIILGMTGYVVLSLGTVFAASKFIQWGDKVDAGSMLIKWVITCFPVLRIISEFILISFIARKSYIVYIAGYMIVMLESFLTESLMLKSHLLSIVDIYNITSTDKWVSYGLCDNNMHYIYDVSVSASDSIITIAVSLICTAVSLYLGYVFFKNDDIN